jgi:tungstate transport system ATP-binding protein
MSTSQLLYRCHNLEQRYGKRLALTLPSLTLARGEVLALLGANGTGKSTLLRLLAFLDKPYSGTIDFYGEKGIAPRRQVTLLLQEPYLLTCSVHDNVAYGLRVRGCSGIQERVEAALVAVGFAPQAISKRLWFELSGGEKQRVALAARLALRPLALLLDEPTSNLDSRSALCIQQAVQQASAAGMAVVIATHDTAWLHSLNARQVILQENAW